MSKKIVAKKIAKTGARTVGDIVLLVLKIIGTTILTILTTGIIFACIFLIYIRTNLTTGLEVNPAQFALAQSSVIYHVDPITNQERELVVIQSTEFRIWVDYDDIPRHMINALVAIEDQRFFQHHGVDWYRTAGAFVNMFLSMRDTFGGSTITQQLIKNLTHDDDATVQRKLQEIFRALEFERSHNKEEILELYLNLVYFGHRSHGIGAAAQTYFGVDVSELSLAQAASIIGITNNPSRFSPYLNRDENIRRQQTILYKMFELGFITETEYRAALAEELVFQRGEHTVHQDVVYTWFEEAVIRDVLNDLVAAGNSEQVARLLLFSGGLRIISTIDLEMQAIVDGVFEDRANLPNVTGSHQPLQSGIVIADPFTGEIRALSGGTGEKRSNMLLNRATSTRRPPGSAIKPISVYAPAMEMGLITPNTLFNDSRDSELVGTGWMPRNYDRRYRGIVTVRRALASSLNTVAALVLDQLLPSNSYRFMIETLGFTSLVPADNDFAPLSMGQLTHGATVREMTAAFTMFPNAGQHATLRTYSRVYDHNGNILLDNQPQFTRAISEVNAYWMTDMLVESVVNGTGRAAILPGGMPSAGKTGTTTDRQDRWFVGFTPYYVAAVWTGFDRPAPMTSSGNPAAQIWQRIMAPIHTNLETRRFNRPDDTFIAPPPVANVVTAGYTIRAIDSHGNVIAEFPGNAAVGRDRTILAPTIDGYVVVGESSRRLFISDDPSRNVATFTYQVGEHSTTPPGDPNLPTSPTDHIPTDPSAQIPTDPPVHLPTDPPTQIPTDPPQIPTDPPQIPTDP